MATLKQAGEFITTELRERVDELVSAVEDEAQDFSEIVRRADAVGELVDAIGETYGDLEQTLMRALQRGSGSGPEDDDAQQEQDAGRQQQAGPDGAEEDVTKEELLERAREMNVSGRSSMSKEELAQAIEAEESLTKEELLERAREAGIEGRSSMTKEELREALREGGA
jgi:hypothetical protein